MAPLIADMPVDEAWLRDPSRSIDWDVWVLFMDRVDRACGGAAGVEALFVPGAGDRTQNSFSVLARSILSVDALYRLFFRWGVPRHLTPVKTSIRHWRSGAGRVVFTIDPTRAGSAPTLHFLLGVLRSLPLLHRRRAAAVTGSFTEREAIFDIDYPTGGSILGRLRWKFDLLTGAVATGDELAEQAAEISSQNALLASQLAELRKVEADLRENQEWLAIALDAAKVGVWSIDLATRASVVSPEFRELTGLHGPDPVTDLLDRVHPEDRPGLDRANDAAHHADAPIDVEYRYDHPDGRVLWLNGKGRITRNALGHAVRTSGSVIDISERKAMEAQLRVADRLISAGTLAAGVAHEINNPLTYILGNLELVRERLPAIPGHSAALEASLAEMEGGLWRIREVVRDLRNFARPPEDASGPVDLCAVTAASSRMVAHQIRHVTAVVFEWDASPLHVLGNEFRLGQVFVNLLLNAAQAMPARPFGANQVRVSGRHGPEGRVVVEVTDNGSGILPENLGRVFDPFFTTKPVGEGTGLGLAVGRGLVLAMGGTIDVVSQVGVGTTFRISLPAATAVPGASGPPPDPVGPTARGRVLIVDDEPLVRRAIAAMLVGSGVDVAEADGGQVALDRIRAGEGYDLILCDLMMPGVTGMDLHAALREHLPDAADRMLFLSGGAPTARARAFIASMPDRLVEKPVELPRFLALVRRWLPPAG